MFVGKSIAQEINVVNYRKEQYVNDYWDYLMHAQEGAERKNHKYYARTPNGVKNGKVQYLYFYSKDEYAAYIAGKNKSAKKPTEREQKKAEAESKAAQIRLGKKKLTGEYAMEKHPNGRFAYAATEQYTDTDGHLKQRKKYVDAKTADEMRDMKYRKEKAEKETPEEKQSRMKAAKKRYKKRTAASRRKIAIQKGAQRVARLLGKQLNWRETTSSAERRDLKRKGGWERALFTKNTYLRKNPNAK